MSVYKGKYTKQSDDTYTVELYTDDTVSETISDVLKLEDVKSLILVWYAEKGYTDRDSTYSTNDWDNFDSICIKS